MRFLANRRDGFSHDPHEPTHPFVTTVPYVFNLHISSMKEIVQSNTLSARNSIESREKAKQLWRESPGKRRKKGGKEKVRGCLVVSYPSSCTSFMTTIDVDRAVAVAMVLADFVATTTTPAIFAGSEAAGMVSAAVHHVLGMAPLVATVLGPPVLRVNRPCRRWRRSRPGFLPDRLLRTCTRTK